MSLALQPSPQSESARDAIWGDFVRTNRIAQHLTRRALAERSGIDPSYITLIERDGFVPRRDKVLAIARGLCVSFDLALLRAGYAPRDPRVLRAAESAIQRLRP